MGDTTNRNTTEKPISTSVFPHPMLVEMFILVIIFALMGTALGTFTGITPGIHVNKAACINIYFSVNSCI